MPLSPEQKSWMVLTVSQFDWLESMCTYAKAAEARHPEWPKALGPVTVAQSIQETGWGKHLPAGSNNPFGIKALKGQPFVGANTWEDTNGAAPGGIEHIKAPFRKFADLGEAVEAHGALLMRPVYAHAREHANDPYSFARALTGVYATDPNYGRNLSDLLTKYVMIAWGN